MNAIPPSPALPSTPRVVVALGSNLGHPVEFVRAALNQLSSLSLGPVIVSSLWNSTPVDCPPGSPDFINACALFQARPGETAESILARLFEIEREFGRQPKQLPNEARPLDLDLISFGEETRQSRELTLPHPRAHLRRFVLAPLAEIAPDLTLPGWHHTVSHLLQALDNDESLSPLPSH